MSPEFESRLRNGGATDEDDTWLFQHAHGDQSQLARHARILAKARRRATAGSLDYLILVPTLRCNLACSYCQVSRASVEARGFDWSQETLSAVLELVRNLEVPAAKIEFQGGEPTLRPDLIEAVMAAAPSTVDMTYVVCTNLQMINDEILALFDRPNVQISTSLDGDRTTHTRQRQANEGQTDNFIKNLEQLLARYGPGKISALPTVDPRNPPPPDSLIEAYVQQGLTSIFLRPINFQGFARKRHPYTREQNDRWSEYYEQFLQCLITRNWAQRDQPVLEETYFSLILRRIFRPGQDRHVDLRNPNPIGRDYIVIDYDGQAYPTDEARMLSRSGVIDLSIGDVISGWDTPEREALEAVATNVGDPVCDACAYQPFCGRDIVDDIARYGTILLPRDETEFCRRHMHLFDLAFHLIYSRDGATQFSLRRWLGIGGDTVELGAER